MSKPPRRKGSAFAQDLGHGAGTVSPAKGKMKRGKARALNTKAAKGQGGFSDTAAAGRLGRSSLEMNRLNAAEQEIAAAGSLKPGAGKRGGGTNRKSPGAGSLVPYDPKSATPGGRKGGGGAYIVGPGDARAAGDAYGKPTRAPQAGADGPDDLKARADAARYSGGVLQGRNSSADPRFYAKKRAVEAVLGRELHIDEFLADHYVPDDAPTAMGTSIFDPVLCELAYRWFCPPGGLVLDPFAGGSVRGVVAGVLGRRYVGIDLRAEQVHANRVQAELIFEDRPDGAKPFWVEGDSAIVLRAGQPSGDKAVGNAVDFVFSCPPYADLEVYSDDPADLSTMTYPEFRRAYAEIIRLACARLRPDRFACFVVGDVRDADGCYLSFPQHTIEAFEAAGLRLYNDAILVTAAGSLPIRAGRQFAAGRKLGTTHQRVLVFVKGDGMAATAAIGEVEAGVMFDEAAPAEDAEIRQEPPESAAPPAVPPAADREGLTRVDGFGAWYAKREDTACDLGPDYPTGAKVRQFLRMAEAAPGAPMVVGCSADSAMQVYLAAAARLMGVEAHIFVPARKVRSEATAYAVAMGAHVTEIRPGYLSVCRARAKEFGKGLGATVRWDPRGATLDTMAQVANLPADVLRVVVPLGSGAICAGVIAGLAEQGRVAVPVLAVAVSDMADPAAILANAAKFTDKPLPLLEVIPPASAYDAPAFARLPDGTVLDPFYAAKALPHVGPGDCLWVSGLRPASARPGGSGDAPRSHQPLVDLEQRFPPVETDIAAAVRFCARADDVVPVGDCCGLDVCDRP